MELSSKMKIAILANRKNSFVRILAEGLFRSFLDLEKQPKIFYLGLRNIREYNIVPSFSSKLKKIRSPLIKKYQDCAFFKLIEDLNEFDLIIVVSNIPLAFMKGFMRDGILREKLPHIPIVLYSNYYLKTRGSWEKHLRNGNPELGIPEGDNYGLERYDHYLCSSVVSEYAMPQGYQPYSLIGLNINDQTLFPQQKSDFIALLDFRRDDCLEERKIQIEALKETETPYMELKGKYSIKEIRQIYRKSSIYFVAHRESFGLPICELQACGSYIFTPYSNWCPSHWIKEDLTVDGPGYLSKNFIVYDNCKTKLIDNISRIKKDFDSSIVLQRFLSTHPHLFWGDIKELKTFLDRVKTGKINSKSHADYRPDLCK